MLVSMGIYQAVSAMLASTGSHQRVIPPAALFGGRQNWKIMLKPIAS